MGLPLLGHLPTPKALHMRTQALPAVSSGRTQEEHTAMLLPQHSAGARAEPHGPMRSRIPCPTQMGVPCRRARTSPSITFHKASLHATLQSCCQAVLDIPWYATQPGTHTLLGVQPPSTSAQGKADRACTSCMFWQTVSLRLA